MVDLRRLSLSFAAAALLAAAPLCAPAAAATFTAAQLTNDAALLGSFNLITTGNVTSTGTGSNATIDGRAFVGGNLSTTNTESVCISATCSNTGNVDGTGATYGAVTVFGNVVGSLTANAAGGTSGGDINVRGGLSSSTYNLNGLGGLNVGAVGASGSSASPNVVGPKEIRTTLTSPQGTISSPAAGFTYSPGQTLAQVFPTFNGPSGNLTNVTNPLTNLSRGIANLPGTPGVRAEALPANNATFFTSGSDYTYNGKSYGVVTTTLANLAQNSNTAGAVTFSGVQNGAGNAATFVIVTGDGANYMLPTLNLANTQNVIYEFVDATTLKFGGIWTGSVLAPLATITQQNGTLNGSIVVAAFNQTKELLSSDSFTGDLTGLTGVQFSAVPEPASLALLGIGAAAVAFVRRRR